MRRIRFIVVFFLSLCSCLVFQHRQARDLYVESGHEGTIKNAELILDSLTVQKGFDTERLEANAVRLCHCPGLAVL